MSLRSKRIIQEFNMLKEMYRAKKIRQLKSANGNKKNIEHLKILLVGPKNTPYQGGLFKLEVRFPKSYPMEPPFVRLHTPIWHPNFWPDPKEFPGRRNICLDLVNPSKKGNGGGWTPSKSISTVINSIYMMLDTRGAFVNPTDVYNKKAGLELMKNRKAFEKKARTITKKYAREKWN
ncbi:MAG: ubiquitin-conjugating enzyme E2 [Candidatus Helarchaeota archaeon]